MSVCACVLTIDFLKKRLIYIDDPHAACCLLREESVDKNAWISKMDTRKIISESSTEKKQAARNTEKNCMQDDSNQFSFTSQSLPWASFCLVCISYYNTLNFSLSPLSNTLSIYTHSIAICFLSLDYNQRLNSFSLTHSQMKINKMNKKYCKNLPSSDWSYTKKMNKRNFG